MARRSHVGSVCQGTQLKDELKELGVITHDHCPAAEVLRRKFPVEITDIKYGTHPSRDDRRGLLRYGQVRESFGTRTLSAFGGVSGGKGRHCQNARQNRLANQETRCQEKKNAHKMFR
jgi:hypothetical protein